MSPLNRAEPDITSTTAYQNLVRTGYYEGDPKPESCCPCCGERLWWDDQVYTNKLTGGVAGCSNCLGHRDAAEWLEEVS